MAPNGKENGFANGDIPEQEHELVEIDEKNDTCTKLHCFYCCDALYTFFHDEMEMIPPAFEDGKYPLFVTWNIKSSRPGGHARLRGCIGNFEPQELYEGLKDYALIAGRQDSRFNPITERELERLECQVSLLTDFEDARNYLDWTIGTHGIYISFPHPSLLPPASSLDPSPLSSHSGTPVPPGERGRGHWWSRGSGQHKFKNLNATYLPEVAPEQGWTQIEAIDSAIRKAGWDGRITEDLRRSIKLRRYQSRKCGVQWDEFIKWREEQVKLQDN
ncbi:hypothetical protein DACRYDRAFT_97121 [Dacryopinax primogenitus]|uniref:AMMECR1 domain-containing protein n=1 Tax=Dacryopinax primogenitus (strain DJM 731) TaxID=1858805 RepID=M5FWF8_DACPD|nr:uncharacterized protein DACRYDRAFT_97121 [Dacryopinax primogenitus]EJT97731.1 hypothetical protein DACRYDRAFT_97121 [Dacryopinax primogenitus]